MTLSGKVPNGIYQLGLNSAVAFFSFFFTETGLVDLSAELVRCTGQGDRPAGRTCGDLWLIVTDSVLFLLSFFWSFHQVFRLLTFCCKYSSKVVW